MTARAGASPAARSRARTATGPGGRGPKEGASTARAFRARDRVASRVGSSDGVVHLAKALDRAASSRAASGRRAVVSKDPDRSAGPVASRAAAIRRGRAYDPAAHDPSARGPREAASMLPGPTVGREAGDRSGLDRPAAPAVSVSRVLGRAALPARVRVVIGQAGHAPAVSGRMGRIPTSMPERPIAREVPPVPPGASGRPTTRGRRGRPDPTAPRAPARSHASARGPAMARGPATGPAGRRAARASDRTRKASSNATARMRRVIPVGRDGAAHQARVRVPAIAAAPHRAPASARVRSRGDLVSGSAATSPSATFRGRRSRRSARPAARGSGPRRTTPCPPRISLPGVRPVPDQLGRLHAPTIALAPAGSSVNVPLGPAALPAPRGRGRPQVRRRPTFSARMRSWSPAAIR